MIYAGYRVCEVAELTDKIKQEIIEVGMDAFGDGMTPEEIIEHIQTDKLYIAKKGSNTIGFATANILEESIDLVGAAVSQGDQENGLYKLFIDKRMELAREYDKKDITFRTQNPRILKGVVNSLESMVKSNRLQEYNVELVLMPGLYERQLTSEIPKTGDDAFDTKFALLDYPVGDAYSVKISLGDFL